MLVLLLALALGARAAHAVPFAYVPNSQSISVVDTATNTVVGTVALTGTTVAVNPAGTRLYVASGYSPFIWVVDAASNTLLDTVNLPGAPGTLGITVSPDGGHVYVAGPTAISVIDAATNAVISSISGVNPDALAVSPDGTLLYATDFSGNQLLVIDLASQTIISKVAVACPTNVAANLLGSRVYVTTEGGGDTCPLAASVSVIDTATNTVIATVALDPLTPTPDSLPQSLAVTPDSALVYVAVVGSANSKNRVVAIDTGTNTISSTLLTGSLEPTNLAVSPSGTAVYVIGGYSNSMLVLDALCNTVTSSLAVPTSGFFFGGFVAPAAMALPAQGAPPPNLHVTGIEVTQGIQDLAGSVPLISGRRTFVRVYVQADGLAELGVTAGLSAIGNIACTPGTCPPVGATLGPLAPSNTVGPQIAVVPNPSRTNLNDSFLFELPVEWTQYQSVRLHPVLYVNGQKPRQACAKDILTEPLRTFQSATTLEIQFVRLSYQLPGTFNGLTNQLVQASVTEQKQSESYLRRTYPLSNLILAPDLPLFDAGLGSRIARTAPECTSLPASQINLCAFNYVTAKLAALQASSGPLLGLLPGPPGSGFVGSADGAYGLIPQVPNDPQGRFFTRGACCTNRIAAGPSSLNFYAAHEMGHLLGRQHPVPGAALCGHSASDPNYPYPLSLIANQTNEATELAGFDGGDAALQLPMQYLTASQGAFDNMGYCSQHWISDYTYNALYICLLALHSAEPGTPAACTPVTGGGAGGSGNWLSVFGTINPNAARADFIAQRLDRVVSVPPSSLGNYTIQLIGAGAATLASYPFAPASVGESQLAGAGPVLSFGQVVPFVAGTQMIQIVDSTTNQAIGQKTVSPNAPLIGSVALQGTVSATGLATIAWSASDADGDPLTFDIFFTRDQGVSLQPVMLAVSGSSAQIDTTHLAGGQGQFRVRASDGVNTAWADSPPFTLPNKQPSPYIVQPADGQTLYAGQLLNLEGEATDLQDGVIGDTGLAWSSFGTPIGSGARISLPDLPLGTNAITLTATNSLGLSASVTVHLNVIASAAQPGPTLTAGPQQIGWQVAAGESTPQTATLNIDNAGSGNLEFMAQSNAPWLTVSPSSGEAPTTITLTASPASFAAGTTQRATLTMTAAGTSGQVTQLPVMLSIGNTFVGGQTSSPVVPNVIGLTQSAASASIGGAGLLVGAVSTQSSAAVATGTVISESPAAGTIVSSGSSVNLVVSSGPLIGDVNGDGVVNCADIAIVKAAFGSKVGNSNFDPRADVNKDGVVNIIDLSTVARALPAGTVCK
jgi:YVTN family beta-propeller protein